MLVHHIWKGQVSGTRGSESGGLDGVDSGPNGQVVVAAVYGAETSYGSTIRVFIKYLQEGSSIHIWWLTPLLRCRL